MPSTYSSNLKIELMATGENSGTWGTTTNTNLGTALEQSIVGYGNPDYPSDANLTISLSNTNAAQTARALVLNVTSVFGSLTATRELVVPTIEKQYIVQNNTTGGQSITVKTTAGTGITVPNGRKAHLYVDGTNVIQMFDFVDINGGAIDGTPVGANSASTGAFTTLTLTNPLTVPNGGTGLASGTSGGIPYFSSTTAITSSAALAANALVVGGGAGVAPSTITTGTDVLTALGVNVGSAGAFVVNGGALGTPSSGTVTNLTGTASININGTVGATTPTTGDFTAVTSTSEVVTGASGILTRAAATQDGVALVGRAGGTSSYEVTMTPTTLTADRTLTLPDATTTVVGTDATQTLTSKRVTPRISTDTSSATPTINTDTTDIFGLTAQAVDITSFTTNLSGTPTDGQKLWIFVVGTAARAITWGASFEASTVALPTTTVTTNRLDVGFVWNAATSKWRCVATA